MKQENQVIMESKVKGNFNITKQKGKIKAKSDVNGNLNYTNQENTEQNCSVSVSWWTKTHVICVAITTLLAILGFLTLHGCIKL